MNQCPPQVPCYPKKFYEQVLAFLCAINKNISGQTQGIRYDYQLLCDPNTAEPVFVRTAYKTDGSIPANNVEAFLPTGEPYTSGIIADLVACASGGGGGPVGGPYRFDYEVLCNPVNGAPVLLQVPYNIDGNIYPYSAFNSDGSPYSGNIANLIACNAVAGGSTRYDYEFLCDPNTGVPVFVRATYNINGTQGPFVAYNLDGSAYSGDITLLVGCGQGSSAIFNGWSWQIMCDPTTGRSVFVRITYNSGGTLEAIDGWYGDLSEYTGDPYNLVDCAALSSGGDSFLIWNPTATPNEFSANPGVGLQTVQRNLLSTNSLGLNPLSYPMRCEKYNFQWKEIEDPGPGSYVLTGVNQVLDDCRAALQTMNLKILSYDPASGYTTPDYLYNNGGWQVTDDGGSGTFKLAWWGDAANITALENLHTAIAAVANVHPAMNVLDVGWGDFDENNYDSTHYVTGTVTGSAPVPVVGNPVPDLTLAEAQAFFDAYRAAWGADRLMVTHAAHLISFNYACGVLGMGVRMDGWGYRNTGGNPGGCPGGGVQMCTHAVNTFLPTGTYPNLYLTAPNLEETYGRLYSGGSASTQWLTQGWPFTDSFNWTWQSGGAHTSEINVKGQFNPPSSPTNMRTPFETMLRNLGYRFVITEMRRSNEVEAGQDLAVKVTFSNVGTAPNYRNEVVSFRLYNPTTGYKFYYQTTVASSDFMPGTSTGVNVTIPVPSWFPAGSAQLSVGLAVPNPVITDQVVPEIRLYNSGSNGNDLWYSFPTALNVLNASPAAAPDMVYAATFAFASSQFLSSTSTLFRLNDTDFWIAATVTSLDTSANRGIVSKGSRNTAATQEFWIGYNQATDRIEASWCNGTSIFRATADNFGDVSTKTIDADHPLKILVEFNDTSKIMALSVNNALSDVAPTGTGSIPAGSNTFRIGSDTNNNYMEGEITNVMIGKKLFTGLPTSFRQMLLDPAYVTFPDLPNQIKYGMYYMWEMTETSGNRVDSNCGRALTSNGGGGGVGRVAVYPN